MLRGGTQFTPPSCATGMVTYRYRGDLGEEIKHHVTVNINQIIPEGFLVIREEMNRIHHLHFTKTF